MVKSILSWLVVVLISLGAAIIIGHPAWGTVTGLAICLVAGGIAAVGAVLGVGPTRIVNPARSPRAAGQKISSDLVSLSSAAILAIYAAGYHRTSPAADQFEVQAARRRTAPPIAATVATPKAAIPKFEAPPPAPPSPATSPKAVRRRPASQILNGASVPTVDSPSTLAPPLVGTPAAEPAKLSPPAPAVSPQTHYKDGTYSGWGSCRHGDIQASVVIQGGRIVSVEIGQCLTRYSCSWIANLPGQVVSRQNPGVDYVSGATQSSDAFSDAVSAALSQASE